MGLHLYIYIKNGRYGAGNDAENSSISSLIQMQWLHQQGHASRTSLLQQNPPVSNCG